MQYNLELILNNNVLKSTEKAITFRNIKFQYSKIKLAYVLLFHNNVILNLLIE